MFKNSLFTHFFDPCEPPLSNKEQITKLTKVKHYHICVNPLVLIFTTLSRVRDVSNKVAEFSL